MEKKLFIPLALVLVSGMAHAVGNVESAAGTPSTGTSFTNHGMSQGGVADSSGNGSSMDSSRSMYGSSSDSMSGGALSPSDKATFDRLDTNHNGVLDETEFGRYQNGRMGGSSTTTTGNNNLGPTDAPGSHSTVGTAVTPQSPGPGGQGSGVANQSTAYMKPGQ